MAQPVFALSHHHLYSIFKITMVIIITVMMMTMMIMLEASGVTTCSDSLWPQALCSLSPPRVVHGDIVIIVTIVTIFTILTITNVISPTSSPSSPSMLYCHHHHRHTDQDFPPLCVLYMRFLSGLWFQPFKATKAHWSSPRSPLRQSDSRTLLLKWASMFTLFKLCLIKVKNSNCTVEQHPSIQASYILVNSMLKLLQGRSSNAWLHIATKHVQNMHLSSIHAFYTLIFLSSYIFTKYTFEQHPRILYS